MAEAITTGTGTLEPVTVDLLAAVPAEGLPADAPLPVPKTPDPESPAVLPLGDAYVRTRGFDTSAPNYTLKLGTGLSLHPFSPDSIMYSGSFETVAPFYDKDKANGGSNGLVAKVGVGGPFAPQEGSSVNSNFAVGYRVFGPEIWIGGATNTPYDTEKQAWGETGFTYKVNGAFRFFAKDYKNDTDLPLFNLSAGLSGPQLGLQTLDAFNGSFDYNPAIHGTWAHDTDGSGTIEAAERVKIEDAYLMTHVGFGSTRLDEDGFLTGFSFDRDTQRAAGMAFDNAFDMGATTYIGMGERNGFNGQRPYMLSLSASYARGWDSNPAADPEYNADLTESYAQEELTPDTGNWAFEARFNFKNTADVDDGHGGKTKAPETPHSMIVNDPMAYIGVSLASSSAYSLGAWHYPANDIGGNTNYRDPVSSNSLVLGVSGFYSKFTPSVPLFGGKVQFKPTVGFTYDFSEGVESPFGANAALSIGYKKKGQL